MTEGKFRLNPQARDWVGRVIADVVALDLSDPKNRMKVTRLVEQWIVSGAFRVYKAKDERLESKISWGLAYALNLLHLLLPGGGAPVADFALRFTYSTPL